MRTVICIAIIMMVQVGGCTEDSVVGVVDIATDSCVPNQTFSCPCLKDGIATFGVQTCQTDGVSFSPCECSLVPMAPSSPRENKREELEDIAAPEEDGEESDTESPDAVEPEDANSGEDVEEDAEADAESGTDIVESDPLIPLVAALLALPSFIDFSYVKVGNAFVEKVLLENAGTDEVTIVGIEVLGNPGFLAALDEVSFVSGEIDLGDIPPVVMPGENLILFLQFASLDYEPADGSVLIHYAGKEDTPEKTLMVTLTGNNGIPIISVTPEELNFGPKLQGDVSSQGVTIVSQGGVPLVVTSVEFTETSSDAFTLDYSQLPGFENGGKPTPETPLVLEIKEEGLVSVIFTPAEGVVANGGDAVIVPAEGLLIVEHNTPDPAKEVPITGLGLVGECPVAIIEIEEGFEVSPQTLLHLSGENSFSPFGSILGWEWSVMQPDGSQSTFLPSDTSSTPAFQANVVGYYMFQLTVTDSTGKTSCVPGIAEVMVMPDEAIHVELVWDTPGDAIQFDAGLGAGADMDLHFLHPNAEGEDLNEDGVGDGWFDIPYDVFWVNPKPNWEDPDLLANDDPSLDRDDKDGAGPENINLILPMDGNTYRVGVHYWAAYEYGVSTATLRVYLSGVLAYEEKDVVMNNHDLWEACTIEWPSGAVEPIGNGIQILPDYVHPLFPPP